MTGTYTLQALVAQWHSLGEQLILQALMEAPTSPTVNCLTDWLCLSIGLEERGAVTLLSSALCQGLVERLLAKGFIKALTLDGNTTVGLMPTEAGWLYLKGLPVSHTKADGPDRALHSSPKPMGLRPEPPAFLIRSSAKQAEPPMSSTVASGLPCTLPDPFGVSQLPSLSIVTQESDAGELDESTSRASSQKPPAIAKSVYVAPTLSADEMTLFVALKEMRSYWAKRQNVPPYCVCRTQSLYEMVLHHPTDEVGLRAIFGVGEGFMTHYGQAFLEVLTRHVLQPCSHSQ
jgi:HRDC domain